MLNYKVTKLIPPEVLRSGHYYITLSIESEKKALVDPNGKCEFHKVPFVLAQVPTYFQRLINEVVIGIFAFRNLDDILYVVLIQKFIYKIGDGIPMFVRRKSKIKRMSNVTFEETPSVFFHLI